MCGQCASRQALSANYTVVCALSGALANQQDRYYVPMLPSAMSMEMSGDFGSCSYGLHRLSPIHVALIVLHAAFDGSSSVHGTEISRYQSLIEYHPFPFLRGKRGGDMYTVGTCL